MIEEILNLCKERDVFVIHSCSRRKLGNKNKISKKICLKGLAFAGKFGPKISLVSIINYQNYEEDFNELRELVNEKQKEFNMKITPNAQI